MSFDWCCRCACRGFADCWPEPADDEQVRLLIPSFVNDHCDWCTSIGGDTPYCLKKCSERPDLPNRSPEYCCQLLFPRVAGQCDAQLTICLAWECIGVWCKVSASIEILGPMPFSESAYWWITMHYEATVARRPGPPPNQIVLQRTGLMFSDVPPETWAPRQVCDEDEYPETVTAYINSPEADCIDCTPTTTTTGDPTTSTTEEPTTTTVP